MGERGKKSVLRSTLDYFFAGSSEPSNHPLDSRVTGRGYEPENLVAQSKMLSDKDDKMNLDTCLSTAELGKQSSQAQEVNHTAKLKGGEKYCLEARIFDLETEVVKYKAHCEKLHTENQSLHQSNDQLIKQLNSEREEREYVSSRYGYIIRKCLQPYADHLKTEYNDTDGGSMKGILTPLLKDAVESHALRNQIQSLQQEMLAKVEKVQAVTDDQFAQDFRTLASSVKALSRRTEFYDVVDIFEVLGPHVSYGLLIPERYVYCKKKLFLEIYIWSTLLSTVFEHPFAIFGPLSKDLNNMWSAIFQPPSCYSWPAPTSICEVWRYTTMEQLVGLVGRDIIATGESDRMNGYCDESIDESTEESVDQVLSNGVIQIREQVINSIFTGLEKVSSEVDIAIVHQIVDKAFSLALQMSLQRSRLQMTYPHVGSPFIKHEMSCLPDADGNDLEEGIVDFTINPGLAKWGDALGKKLDLRYDIVPSLVQLEPEVSETDAGVSLI